MPVLCTSAAVRSKAVVLLLLIHCLLLLSLCVGLLCLVLVLVFFLAGEERAGCLTLIVFLLPCGSWFSVSLSRGAVDWPAVCDCGISWSYSL